MNAVIKSITSGSIAAETIISPGDILRKINGNVINDVLDYMYYSYDEQLLLELTGTGGKLKLIRLRKPEGTDIGLEFETFLMDKERSCVNKCIFCFMDQLPRGMRETLYYKDDDIRLSFLQGNYITLTNLTENDIERIIRLRISPVNVSIHTMDPALRCYMMGNANAGAGVEVLRRLAGAGILLNCQIVCCPGVNDGRELSNTIEELIALGDGIKSVSVVPIGLTAHRDDLTELRPFDRELALQTVGQVERYSEECLNKRGSRVFWCADELYMLAELDLPSNEYYEEYPQLENGVGMMRSFITEFEEALTGQGDGSCAPVKSGAQEPSPCPAVVTGVLAHKYIANLIKTAEEKYDTILGEVHAVRNEFFGGGVTVSGLVTGGDIIKQLQGKITGTKLLIPRNMLRHNENVFLDDVTVPELSAALGIPICVTETNGADFLNALLS